MSNLQNPKVPPGGSHLRPHIQTTLISPEVAEPVGRKLGVADGVLDVLVAEIVLQGSGIVPVVGKFIAACMPQHVRMQGEGHPGGLAEPLDDLGPADVHAALV